MNKKISFIVPAYNAESFIEPCVENILSIPYDNLELVVVDDGSTDKTAEKLKHFSDSRLRVVTQPNRGVSAARNAGIENASGEYLTFVDVDDVIFPSVYAKIFDTIKFDRQFYMYAYEICRKSGVKPVTLPLAAGEYGKDDAKMLCQWLYDNRFSANYKSHYFTGKVYQYLIQKAFIQENNLRFLEDMSFSEDCVFCFSCFNVVENFELLALCPYRYMINEGSAFNRYRPNFFSELATAYERACEIAGEEIGHKNELYIHFANETVRRMSDYINCNLTKEEALDKINEILSDKRLVNAVSRTKYDKWTFWEKLLISAMRKKDAKKLLFLISTKRKVKKVLNR
jgi:glycosyltransferase involved in cell wall biosynthesis